MGYDHEFPYTDASKYNDDWLINQIKKLKTEMSEFINLNTIKYADPILWNITSQYETNTVVIDAQNGNAYLSKQPVPAGVLLSNTDYWTIIYNYSDIIDDLREEIVPDNEGKKTTASKDHNQGDLVWLDGRLICITRKILAGTEYVEATESAGISGNFIYTSIERQLSVTYNSDNRRLTVCGWVDDSTQIVTRGDTHIYNGSTQTIEIVEV